MNPFCKGFAISIIIFLSLAIISVNSVQAEEIISSKTEGKDIYDKDLVEIEKAIDGVTANFEKGIYSEQVTALLQALEKLQKLRLLFASSQKIDKVLFLSGKAKIGMGRLIAVKSDLPVNEKAKVDAYHEKHQKDYLIGLGVMYQGGDLVTLIKKYPNSPLAPEAAFIMATEHMGIGECESDMNCHLHHSIDAFSPFIENYPTHPKIKEAVDEINVQLRALTWDPKENGLSEIYDIEDTTILFKKCHGVVKKILDDNMRADSLYLLARAFISVGQFELADKIYGDLESHYPKYRNAKSQAAYMVIDYSEQVPAGKDVQVEGETRYTARLSDSSEKARLETLDKINHANISERPLLFAVLMTIGNLLEKDKSPAVRKRAIEVIGRLAPKTSFFRAVVGYCLRYDRAKQNRYYCADLGVNNPDLKSTEFYAYNSDLINAIISEVTGKTYPSDEMIKEWQDKAIQRDREAADEILRRFKELKERK